MVPDSFSTHVQQLQKHLIGITLKLFCDWNDPDNCLFIVMNCNFEAVLEWWFTNWCALVIEKSNCQNYQEIVNFLLIIVEAFILIRILAILRTCMALLFVCSQKVFIDKMCLKLNGSFFIYEIDLGEDCFIQQSSYQCAVRHFACHHVEAALLFG